MLWIPFTLMAAFMQAWRNAFQNQLSKEVSTAGVTLSRFIYAPPVAAIYLALLYLFKPAAAPQLSITFVGLVLLAALAQILATALMVVLFRKRNYAIGVGLVKSEAVIAAILGALFFGAALNATAWVGVIIGALAFWLMTNPKSLKAASLDTLLIGLGSGLAFALTTLWVREASLVLGLPFPHGAAWVLLLVLMTQAIVLGGWVAWREPDTLKALLARPGQVLRISVLSCLGSLGWFTAMSLETVALVKTLGQVEVLFTLLISARWFKEQLSLRDLAGLALIVVGAVCVVLA
ncbi:DMT family transporter [Marinobacterium sp. AK62]|uniref:DMT family transporter n=1 Tax=Marinobacterium alkalitolerans TaxID=1542925 RepID=A0ABS3Z8K8_9GAMM|nr:DMT family transporter [Marinobacterium alkalitolerans]MBP0048052.1 DMT family transporter [Marinobacterium alkalitolerans]